MVKAAVAFMSVKHSSVAHGMLNEGVVPIGGTYASADSLLWIAKAVRRPGVKTYCETGLNGGHSSLAALTSNAYVRVIAIDNFQERWVAGAASYLTSRFGDRFTAHKADVFEAGRTWTKVFPGVECDVFFHGEWPAATLASATCA